MRATFSVVEPYALAIGLFPRWSEIDSIKIYDLSVCPWRPLRLRRVCVPEPRAKQP